MVFVLMPGRASAQEGAGGRKLGAAAGLSSTRWRLVERGLLDRRLHGVGVKRPVVQQAGGDLDVTLRAGLAGRAELAQVGHFLAGRVAQGMPAHQRALAGIERGEAELLDVADLRRADV